ncbi:MAG: phosphoenolpyruvate synthase [Planctomycetota bacterium]
MSQTFIRWFEDLSIHDVPLVGGKNASLGEMIRHLRAAGILVPDGFAITADAYRHYVEANDIGGRMSELLARLRGGRPLPQVGKAIRALFLEGHIPDALSAQINEAYRALSTRCGSVATDVAVRSSATAEDLPTASFAGQQETLLNVRGSAALLEAVRTCLASLFTDRAIAYRDAQGFDHMEVALSVGVQQMVHSDLGGAGVMFTLDTETGFPDVIVINAAHGLGETVVQGTVTPDEIRVFKPLLDRPECVPIVSRVLGAKEVKMVLGDRARPTVTIPTDPVERQRYVLDDTQVLRLARWAQQIEAHYGRPMDIEWALDGATGELFIVQARPETVQSRRRAGTLRNYRLTGTPGEPLVNGLAIGSAIAAGTARVLHDLSEAGHFGDGDVLVAPMTDPDWVPLMKRASAIVTDHGGRTSHAAIVSRDLGVAAVVGCENATQRIADGAAITVSCAEGETGHVYAGSLAFEESEVDVSNVPATRTQIMLNVADPDVAMAWWRLPTDGVGLARMEFIINQTICIHPMALVRFNQLRDTDARARIRDLTAGYADKKEYFIEKLALGISRIAMVHWPKPVILRLSDFKTNEYAELIGGREFEPHEENPMIGFRGASRYYSDLYREGFALECRAIQRVRERIGLSNVVVMIPFCRTLEEADRCLAEMAANGLTRGENGLEVYVMCEIPSNVILAREFAERFDGFSIGSNDLTQLTLGVDRDSDLLSHLFDERNPAVTRLIRQVIADAHACGSKVGICGQAPSDYPEFAAFLVDCGIDSISLNPDSVIRARHSVAEAENRRDTN